MINTRNQPMCNLRSIIYVISNHHELIDEKGTYMNIWYKISKIYSGLNGSLKDIWSHICEYQKMKDKQKLRKSWGSEICNSLKKKKVNTLIFFFLMMFKFDKKDVSICFSNHQIHYICYKKIRYSTKNNLLIYNRWKKYRKCMTVVCLKVVCR